MKSSKDSDGGLKDVPSNRQESSNNSPNKLSHAERQELQSKLTKLSPMSDEVDRRQHAKVLGGRILQKTAKEWELLVCVMWISG